MQSTNLVKLSVDDFFGRVLFVRVAGRTEFRKFARIKTVMGHCVCGVLSYMLIRNFGCLAMHMVARLSVLAKEEMVINSGVEAL